MTDPLLRPTDLAEIADALAPIPDDHKPLSPGTSALPLRFPASFLIGRKEIAVATSIAREFEAQLINLLPRMRIWALALTKNRSAADDLVQDVATKALAKRTNFEL